LNGGHYLVIIMDRHEVTHTELSIGLYCVFYLAIVMERLEGQHTSLTIALHIGL
jgi:hypothetical protein